MLFKNLRGRKCIDIRCQAGVPCHGLALENVKLIVKGSNGDAKSTRQNAEWMKSGTVLLLHSHVLQAIDQLEDAQR